MSVGRGGVDMPMVMPSVKVGILGGRGGVQGPTACGQVAVEWPSQIDGLGRKSAARVAQACTLQHIRVCTHQAR